MLGAIYAVGNAGEFALPDGSLPWAGDSALREAAALDMENFRRLTLNQTVIMGFRTYLSIGRPLADRENVVISSRGTSGFPAAVRIFPSLEEALNPANIKGRAFLIGGAALLSYAFEKDLVDEVYETVFKRTFPRATLFMRTPGRFTLKSSTDRGLVVFNRYKKEASQGA